MAALNLEFLNRLPLIYILPGVIGLVTFGGLVLLFRRRSHPNYRASDMDLAVSALDTGPSDQRVATRRTGNPIQLRWRVKDDYVDRTDAYLLDRSQGGLRLLMPGPIAKGTILVVLPTSADPMVPSVEVEVLSCQETKTGVEIGCRFVKSPPYSILLLFG